MLHTPVVQMDSLFVSSTAHWICWWCADVFQVLKYKAALWHCPIQKADNCQLGYEVLSFETKDNTISKVLGSLNMSLWFLIFIEVIYYFLYAAWSIGSQIFWNQTITVYFKVILKLFHARLAIVRSAWEPMIAARMLE